MVARKQSTNQTIEMHNTFAAWHSEIQTLSACDLLCTGDYSTMININTKYYEIIKKLGTGASVVISQRPSANYLRTGVKIAP